VIGRISRCAVMRIVAKDGVGELGHVRLGDDHGSGGAETAHHGRIGGGRRRIGENDRARARGLTHDIEQILDADDFAVERP
jgi:hypothetical protein